MAKSIEWHETIYPALDSLADEAIDIVKKESSYQLLTYKLLNVQAKAIKAAIDAGDTEEPWQIASTFSSLVFQRMMG